ncbi:class I SAM-dependent methyltransferase [Wenzhouxiangella sp. AB-CW3]|uniref:class I SAM-dependent methyltransferase n=1 Tax=Wenzhouxiangella sp. AB-CW3 TaxID=2771012 RepID=UPI00168A4A99|nr:class I SAM-dependent methyltransferase [Wenzhouxiangella sp. AB-CW3]QOC23323.1 class I SAM-dependent methyltransferase [Wenzhouxiangella sp. AB-CW3]
MTDPGLGQDHWARHAAQWAHVGHPLRPSDADIAVARELVSRATEHLSLTSPRALVLGVTPELLDMRWPERTRLAAIDRCPGMIGAMLSERPDPAGVCGNWLQLPFADGSFDLVVGDGCLTVLESAGDHRRFGSELARILAPGGCLVLRLFIRPHSAETLDEIVADLNAGRIGNFHVFKWRLAMALVDDSSGAVPVADIWQAWRDIGFAPARLAAEQGWPLAEIETIEAYRHATARYTFPKLDEARAALSVSFEELACRTPAYELGERCPTMLFTVR